MKKKVWLFFWGMSNEHEVSIASAKNVIKHIDQQLFELVLIFWSKKGDFYKINSIEDIQLLEESQKISFENIKSHIDIALLMTHGKYWEDGVLQAMLERQKIPYTGCRVLSSSVCMDKWFFKQLMDKNTIKQTRFEIIDFSLVNDETYKEKLQLIQKTLPLPLYVKPANSGSSVGITKVTDFNLLESAIQEARKHDSRIIVEEWLISPKEIEVAVLWNWVLTISEPWELILTKDFYDYEDKYKNNEVSVKIPADINESLRLEIKTLAEKIYRISDCRGFARIDFFISNNHIYINEINTLPGFTDISMYPMLMQSTGMSYKELITQIISLAY